jgi:hypothetical protein
MLLLFQMSEKNILFEAAEKAEGNSGFWSALPAFLWFSLVLVALLLLSSEIRALLQNLSWRLRTGAAVKLFSMELGQTYVSPAIDASKDETTFEHKPDLNDERYLQREQYYKPNRNIQLVHRLAPSSLPGVLYDIEIYLVPHKDATLASVSRVEYYFGKHWGGLIFTSRDRSRSFSITTSAFGSFMCTAKLIFTDGDEVMVGRYVDFEMGAIGRRS